MAENLRTGFGDFSISTRHMRQFPATERRSWKQKRGTLIPVDSIACRMLEPLSICTGLPSTTTSMYWPPSLGTRALCLSLWIGRVFCSTARPSSPIGWTTFSFGMTREESLRSCLRIVMASDRLFRGHPSSSVGGRRRGSRVRPDAGRALDKQLRSPLHRS